MGYFNLSCPNILFSYILATTIKDLINKLFINPKKKKQLLRNLRIDFNELDKILDNFHLISRSKCDDSNHILKKVNSQSSSIQVKCVTCGKTSWINPSNNNYEADTLNKTFYSCDHLKLYNENYILTFNYSERSSKLEKQSRHISQAVKDKVWNNDGGKCVQCGSNQKLEFDHIMPPSKVGANTYRNIQLLCESSHHEKRAKIG